MDKVLYVGENPIKNGSGGDWINKRNLLALQEIYHSNLLQYNIKCWNRYVTFINLICGCMLGLSPQIMRKIIYCIKNENINIVFLASSKLGKLAEKIKQECPEVKVVVFFHNIEKQYTEKEYEIRPSLKNLIVKNVTALNEKLSCRYGDTLIVLNHRDSLLLASYYQVNSSMMLPTTFIDKYESNKRKLSQSRGLSILFVGFAFFANIEGIRWFINEVFSNLQECNLTIVGNGMDQIFSSSTNIRIIGYVDDLADFYYNADLVVLPIFSGGGMKTKTAEALMYGCPIVGTTEAFTGYEIDFAKIGGLANTKEQMVNCINQLKNNRKKIDEARRYARDVFKRDFEFSRTIDTLRINLCTKEIHS